MHKVTITLFHISQHLLFILPLLHQLIGFLPHIHRDHRIGIGNILILTLRAAQFGSEFAKQRLLFRGLKLQQLFCGLAVIR